MKGNDLLWLKTILLVLGLSFYVPSNGQESLCKVSKCEEEIVVSYLKEKLGVSDIYVSPVSIIFQLGASGESVIRTTIYQVLHTATMKVRARNW